ncbi:MULTISPECIES: tRNA glutamyl-Q(34) synthetase GluQRS [Rhizobium/Agrobacterium group]|uniref:tRNA glutamyl-Q(34) synthetase GluQRS n=1 Tax=Rhizobium/Agrobacterium group TaxID=227290 RepID=UPI0015727D7F|nr:MULTISPECIES: tRNA glutamyl-Q(34) synthetase GluQRS [Rhizobium/Agrobacterium group]MBD8651928.1 tRNA glutamyl-Q(34) synthetase GluQRS [Rhizobium sp. CFBP 13726]NSY18761.1 tRNA glutamyl-Q(34) synthetase GluQRS [Neorhizobium sp. AL 9.2.2]
MPAAQIATNPDRPILRFAPSPNGLLHLGHALSAILNHDMARDMNGRFMLRIEDIDLARCTPDYEDAIYRDLHWLGLSWEEPPRRQSEHFETYRQALAELMEMGLVYPAFMTRGEVKARVADFEGDGATWPRDPDGSPLYPDHDRYLSETERKTLIESGLRHSWRLDMDKALARVSDALTWREISDGAEKLVPADPAAWGDVVLSRSDAPSSYHLSVTVDDAAQGITHVVRGMDLYHATSVHRLLQELLGLPQPIYHHHRLILGTDGRKLSKSEGSTGLAALRDAGLSPLNICGLLGLKG